MARAGARARACLATVVLALVAVPGGGTGPAVAAPATDPGVYRISGADRYAASANISASTFEPGVPVAYVATGEKFPDALSGGPVAGFRGGPVLLVRQGSIPSATAAELTRLAPQRIVVLGGPVSVSTAVLQALDAYTAGTVQRISGADRYEASANISASTFAPGVPVAYVATGSTFPDALAGGPPGALAGGPVLLVRTDSVPAATAAELTRLAAGEIVVLGGPKSVSTGVQAALEAYTSGEVRRLSGSDRYAAAAGISEDTFGSPVSVAFVATGENFPDALSGGPVGAVGGGPVLLVRAASIPSATAAELNRLRPRRIVILGGPVSVSTAVQAALEQYVVPASTPSVQGTLTQEGGTGAPLAGVRVRVYDSSRTELPSLATVSDANGVYRVLGAPAGSVHVCFDGSDATGGSVDTWGYESECLSNRLSVAAADPVTVASGATTTANARLRGLGAATLTMTDTAGTPLSGVDVYVHGTRSLRVDLTTGANGRVQAPGLPAGSYLVCYDAYDARTGLGATYGYDPYPDCTGPGAAGAPTLTVTAGTTTTTTVPVTASGVVEGRVTASDGSSAGGSTVVVSNEIVAGDGLTVSTSVGNDGAYQVGAVRGNRAHRVCVEPPPGYTGSCVDDVYVTQARTTFRDLVITPVP